MDEDRRKIDLWKIFVPRCLAALRVLSQGLYIYTQIQILNELVYVVRCLKKEAS